MLIVLYQLTSFFPYCGGPGESFAGEQIYYVDNFALDGYVIGVNSCNTVSDNLCIFCLLTPVGGIRNMQQAKLTKPRWVDS